MTVAVPPQGLRRQEDISQAERAALSDAEVYCERRCLAVMLDLFEVRLPSYRLPPGRPRRRLRRAAIQVISRRRGRLTTLPYYSSPGSGLRHVRLSS